MLDASKTKRSWLTQRLANRYPYYTKARKSIQSVAQQFLEPIAGEIEDLYWQSTYNAFNRALTTCDYNQIENLRRLELPPSFEFDYTDKKNGKVYHAPSEVKGQLADGTWQPLTLATNNSLREFWYTVPTRITYSDERVFYSSVLDLCYISEVSTSTINTIGNKGKLWVTVIGNTSFVKQYGGKIQRASVKLTGKDLFGAEIKEIVFFTSNGKLKTKREYSEITNITTEYLDDSALIQIDWLPIGDETHLDTMGVNISPEWEKFRFFALDQIDGRSTLQSLSYTANDYFIVVSGDDSKDIFYEMELLKSDGTTNITALSLAMWPKRIWIVVNDGDYIHFFHPSYELPDREPLKDKTSECVVQIEPVMETCVRGDSVTLDHTFTRPFFRVYKYRWSVTKPDGTVKGLDVNGAEITYGDSAWITYSPGATSNKIGYAARQFDYTFTQNGDHVFKLEAMVKDAVNLNSEVTIQQDIRVIPALTNTAVASLELPASVGTALQVTFDSYGQPWTISDDGYAYRLEFNYDYYMVDFNNKSIFVREDYSNLSVTP